MVEEKVFGDYFAAALPPCNGSVTAPAASPPGDAIGLLLTLCREELPPAPRQGRAQWEELLATARQHGLLLPVWRWLERLGPGAAPPDLVAASVAAIGRGRSLATLQAAELAGLARAGAEAGIRVLALKGVAFASWLEGDPAARASADLDLLVAHRDVAAMGRLLEARGYRMEDRQQLLPEQHFRRPADGLMVDLHWQLARRSLRLPLDREAMWAERLTIRLAGAEVALPGPAWLVVTTAIELVKQYPQLQLAYLRDLDRLLARLPEVGPRAAALAAASDTRRVLAVALGLRARLLGKPPPAAWREWLPVDAKTEALVERMAAGLREEPAEHPRQLRLLGWVAGHAALRERAFNRLWAWGTLLPYLLLPSPVDAAASGGGFLQAMLRRPWRLAAVFLAARWRRRPLSHPRPAPDVRFHLLDDAGILFRIGTSEIWGLSNSAAYLWCCLEDGLDRRAMIEAYRESYGRTKAVAAREVEEILRDWRRLGLIRAAGGPVPAPSGIGPRPAPVPAPRTVRRPPVTAAGVGHYRILATRIILACPDPAASDRLLPVLAPLRAPPADPVEDLVEAVIEPTDAGFVLRLDGEAAGPPLDLDGLAPAVKAALLTRAVNAYPFALDLHAALLRREGHALLLPAAPGGGKTTLAAALARAGFAYHTDEVTLLEPAQLAARGVPVCLSVKAGGEAVLERDYPGLAALPLHRRGDHRLVRYLPPPVRPGDPDLDRHWPVRWIVFPRYRADAPTELRPLSRVEGLRRLLAECLAWRLALDEARVAGLVAWIAGIAVHELEGGDLEAAVRALDGICRLPEEPHTSSSS